MALTISLSYTNEASNGTSFVGTITDATVYGGANPARNTGAFYLTAKKLKSDGSLNYNITVDTYAPATDTTYTFPIALDGWTRFRGVFVPNYSGSYIYSKYEVAYSGGVVYQAIFNGTFSAQAPPNSTYWQVVSDVTALIDNVGTSSAPPNFNYQQYDRIIYPYAKQFFGTASATAALNCCSDCERSEDVLTYEQAANYVDALNNFDVRGQYASGEIVARSAAELASENA